MQKEILKTQCFCHGFLKRGQGKYPEGDMFLGVAVPNIRLVVKQYKDLSFTDIGALRRSKLPEERLAAVLILVAQYGPRDDVNKKAMYDFYLAHTKFVKN